VLRCAPGTIRERLLERGEGAESAAENAESEALDVILSEAVQRHGTEAVYEIETTEQSPAETAREIEAVVAGEREPSAGTVDYTDYL
jgi:adenylate kinase